MPSTDDAAPTGHPRDRQGRAAPPLRRRARQAPPPRRQRPVPRAPGAVRPLPRRPVRRRGPSGSRSTTRSTVAVIGGGFAGLVTAARLARGRRRRRPHHREGRRLRRHLVLEPLPGRPVRHGVVHLPAAARGDRAHADREVRARARDPRALPAHRRSTSASTTTPCSTPRSPTSTWDDDAVALDRPHQPRRRVHGAVRRRWARARCTGPSCRASPASSRSRATRSTPAGGTTTTPAATRAARRWTGWPTSGSAIIGTGATAVQCVPHLGRGLPRALRVPAHAVVDRRPRQPPHRPRVVRRDGDARLAAAAGSRTSRPTRPAAWSTRTW